MELIKKSIGIGALVLSLSGCQNDYQTEIKGVPISVNPEIYQTTSVILDVEGKSVTCYFKSNGIEEKENFLQLIDKEINDGDNQEITLNGRYIGKNFYSNKGTY